MEKDRFQLNQEHDFRIVISTQVVGLFLSFIQILIIFNADAQELKFVETSKIVASDRSSIHQFGSAVDISGNYAVVGATEVSTNSMEGDTLSSAGAVYIYENVNSLGWVEVQKIVPADRDQGDRFGYSVAISGNYIIIGAPYEDEDAFGLNTLSDAGSAYIFEKDDSGRWIEIQKIVAWDRNLISEQFGYAVDIDQNFAIIGAITEDDGEGILNKAGSVYIFEKNNNNQWVQGQKVIGSDRNRFDWFGASLCINKNRFVVGVPNHDVVESSSQFVNNAGAVYIFQKDSITKMWNEIQKITASFRTMSDNFGTSVSIDENYIIVGSPHHELDLSNQNPIFQAGAAYIFEPDEDEIWIEVEKLVSFPRVSGNNFGYSVTNSAHYIIVGSFFDQGIEENPVLGGAAYIYLKEKGNIWNLTQKIVSSDIAYGDYFGISVAVDSKLNLIIGANKEDEDIFGQNTFNLSGSAYIFESNEDTMNNPIQSSIKGNKIKPFEHEVMVYQTTTGINIHLNQYYKYVHVRLIDLSGRVFFDTKENNINMVDVNLNNYIGLYLLSIQTEKGKRNMKLNSF